MSKKTAKQKKTEEVRKSNQEKYAELLELGWSPNMELGAIDFKVTALIGLLIDTGVVAEEDINLSLAKTWGDVFDDSLKDAEKQLKAKYGADWKEKAKEVVREYQNRGSQGLPPETDRLWFPGK